MKDTTLIVITGPTASGKTELALDVAERLGAPIISADSRQIYRGIPITTAVPTVEERARVPHHLIEILDLDQYYNAAMFAADADRIISEMPSQYVVVCGGSMMYIDALLYGLDDLPDITPEVRARVVEMYNQIGLEGLLAYLENLDAERAATIDRQNPRRVMHAIELALSTPNPTHHTANTAIRTFRSALKFTIDRPRHEMFDRINRRVDYMVAMGMEDEARSVYHLRHLNSLNTIGFKEWFAHFDGKMDRQTAIDRIAKNTRVYAKKQLTWLARQSDTIHLNPDNAVEAILSAI